MVTATGGSSDAGLVASLTRGDASALAALYERYADAIFRVAFRRLGDRRLAEEVLQDTFLALWNRAELYDPASGSLLTWLGAIARNRAIDRLRARGPLAYAEPVEELEVADPAIPADELVVAAERSGALHQCMDELDDRTRQVIRTAFFEGVTYEALSVRLSTPLGTVKSWIRRGLLKLRGCLER